MSRQNKVNKNNYDQAGRLTPDDLARWLASVCVRSGSSLSTNA